MTSIVSKGIDSFWLDHWKSVVRNRKLAKESHSGNNVADLEYYAEHGETRQKPHGTFEVIPPMMPWERLLDSYLLMYANFEQTDFEEQGVEGSFDRGLAFSAFFTYSLAEMIEIRRHFLFPERNNGRLLQYMSPHHLPFTALGIVIGADRAFTLGSAQIRAYRKGFYSGREHYPIYFFVLRLLADYLNEPALELHGEAAKEPIFGELFNLWQSNDLDALVSVCLAACDFHTHRWRVSKKSINEFESGAWMRTPFEILLLQKLRELRGLPNPNIDHPLMNSALGKLPPPVRGGMRPDPLILRVHQRMIEDGYNEDEILNLVGVAG